MPDPSAASRLRETKLTFILFVCWIAVLLIAGGASRTDVLGQTLVRGFAWVALLASILVLPSPDFRMYSRVWLFFTAALLLVAAQLIPLPPSIWTNLPGREVFADVSVILKEESLWRPLSISPGWTFNALGALIVPALTLVLAGRQSRERHRSVLTLLLCAAIISTIVGAIQFSGAHFDHPLVNDVEGGVSGLFANRNHFALLLAIACAIVPVWVFHEDNRHRARLLIGGGLLVVFLPTILASGARMGMLLGAAGTALGFLIVRRRVMELLRGFPKLGRLMVIACAGVLMGGVVLATFFAGRAKSFDRVTELGLSDSYRAEVYARVFEMTARYFPFGAGFGTFDPAYRIAEPATALRPQYLNQAHNDLLQIALEGGLPAILLFLAALAWWLRRTWNVWQRREGDLPRLGSVVILLIVMASAVDYPMRTPFIFAIATLAVMWLSNPFGFSSARAGQSVGT